MASRASVTMPEMPLFGSNLYLVCVFFVFLIEVTQRLAIRPQNDARFAPALMRANHTALFHQVNQSGGTCIADTQVALEQRD